MILHSTNRPIQRWRFKAVIALVLIFIAVRSIFNGRFAVVNKSRSSSSVGALLEVRSCILTQAKARKKTRSELVKIVATCVSSDAQSLRLKTRSQMYRNIDENKTVILPDENRDCVILTIGIGDDISVERAIKKDRPLCRFYGADPHERNGKAYDEVGEYLAVGIGAQSGTIKGNIRDEDNRYKEENISVVTIPNLLNRFKLNRIFIDYMMIDIEGEEYALLRTPQLTNPNFCQIDLELHGPLALYGIKSQEECHEIITNFLTQSLWLPLSFEFHYAHQVMHAINLGSPECMRRYNL